MLVHDQIGDQFSCNITSEITFYAKNVCGTFLSRKSAVLIAKEFLSDALQTYY